MTQWQSESWGSKEREQERVEMEQEQTRQMTNDQKRFYEHGTPPPDKVIRSLYWALLFAMQQGYEQEHEDGDLMHDPETCWQCIAVQRLEAVEGQYGIRREGWRKALQRRYG